MQSTVVLVTAPTFETAKSIARILVENKLAACVNIVSSITSIYLWDGKINEDQEYLLIIKTRADLVESQIIPAVKAIHPYQLPEIIGLPVSSGLKEYLDWIDNVTVVTKNGDI